MHASFESLPDPIHPHAAEPAETEPCARGEMLLRVFEALEAGGIPYCVLHGYENYAHAIDSDVDLLIPPEVSSQRLAQVLDDAREQIGGSLVQWFDDGAIFIVLAEDTEGCSPAMLQLHVARHYSMRNRIFFKGDAIIAGRKRHGPLWVPSADFEFACIFINRALKKKLTDRHAARLAELFAEDPAGCEARLAPFLDEHSLAMVVSAARGGEWKDVRHSLSILRRQLLHSRNTTGECPFAAMTRRIRRWASPRNGLHVVFLGPDGVGKSTVIETFQHDLAPAFLRTAYMTFAPSLIPAKLAPKKSTPHQLPPRSKPASFIKAAWWLVCYTFGYFASIRTIVSRGGMVVNHRYLIDAIVDQKRYRYSGPVGLLSAIWEIAPKPDMIFLLDAPPHVIRKRKSELPLDEITRQRERYRQVIEPLPYASVIDASRPREQVIADVEQRVLAHLRQRTRQQLDLGGSH